MARQRKLCHEQFLELIISDEVQGRDQFSKRARTHRARLDPAMVVKAQDDTAKVDFDHDLWGVSCSVSTLLNFITMIGPPPTLLDANGSMADSESRRIGVIATPRRK